LFFFISLACLCIPFSVYILICQLVSRCGLKSSRQHDASGRDKYECQFPFLDYYACFLILHFPFFCLRKKLWLLCWSEESNAGLKRLYFTFLDYLVCGIFDYQCLDYCAWTVTSILVWWSFEFYSTIPRWFHLVQWVLMVDGLFSLYTCLYKVLLPPFHNSCLNFV
jgi:hypothetical protein